MDNLSPEQQQALENMPKDKQAKVAKEFLHWN